MVHPQIGGCLVAHVSVLRSSVSITFRMTSIPFDKAVIKINYARIKSPISGSDLPYSLVKSHHTTLSFQVVTRDVWEYENFMRKPIRHTYAFCIKNTATQVERIVIISVYLGPGNMRLGLGQVRRYRLVCLNVIQDLFFCVVFFSP